MNPQQEQAQPQTLINEDLLRKVVEEMESANPYGMGKYTDEDASGLGIESLGSLRLANQLVKAWWGSPMIPAWIQKSQNPAGTFVACVLRGKELGFKMLESLSALYLSPDGRLGMYGTAMLSLMRKSGVTISFTELKDEKQEAFGYSVYGKRRDGDEYTSTFTRMDATRARLGNVHNAYPMVMCQWRAVSILFRFLCSDLSGGPIYTREELEDDERAQHEEITAEMLGKAENPFRVSQSPKPSDPVSANGKASAPAEVSNSGEIQPQHSEGGGITGTQVATASRSGETVASDGPERREIPPATTPGNKSDKVAAISEAIASAGMSGIVIQPLAEQPQPSNNQVTTATATAPAKRGRPPGASKAIPPPQTASAPAPEPAQGGFKATEDDLPTELQSPSGSSGTSSDSLATHASTSATNAQQTPELTQGQRLSAVLNRLIAGSGHPDKTCRTWMEEVIRTFTKHKGPLPKPTHDVYARVLPFLEAMSIREPDVIKHNPMEVADQLFKGYTVFAHFIDAWPDESKVAALKSVLARCPQTGGSGLVEWLEGIQAEGALKPVDIRVAVKVYGIGRDATAAMMNAENSTGKAFSELLDGVDLGTATEKDVLTKLAGGTPKGEPTLWED